MPTCRICDDTYHDPYHGVPCACGAMSREYQPEARAWWEAGAPVCRHCDEPITIAVDAELGGFCSDNCADAHAEEAEERRFADYHGGGGLSADMQTERMIDAQKVKR